ncbi:MAG: hypothetical protein J0I09_09785 [Sphingobacteriia bacterium]|nr:hypothetical protein [Sphingobacteriia bacterium]
MDKLKEHIQSNRQALDTKHPSDAVWAGIQKELSVQDTKIVSIKAIRWIAAACILLAAGIFWLNAPRQHKLQSDTVNNFARQPLKETVLPPVSEQDAQHNNDVAEAISEQPLKHSLKKTGTEKQVAQKNNSLHNNEEVENTLHSLQNSFVTIINFQRSKINATPIYAEGPVYFRDFTLRFKQMEKDESDIKKQIIAHGLTDELLEQLINIYQQKLNVLKQLQTEINKTNSRYLQTNPVSEITKTSFLNI